MDYLLTSSGWPSRSDYPATTMNVGPVPLLHEGKVHNIWDKIASCTYLVNKFLHSGCQGINSCNFPLDYFSDCVIM